MKSLTKLTLSLYLFALATPAFAQDQQEAPKDPPPITILIDQERSYWINRGHNDTIHHAGSSINSVYGERDKTRLRTQLKVYKSSPVRFNKESQEVPIEIER